MLAWPHGTTTKAARSGPSADPALPPTWKSDWASPCRPPEARRAMRDDSGWNTEEPTPTSAAARSTGPKPRAEASSRSPQSVKPIPAASE